MHKLDNLLQEAILAPNDERMRDCVNNLLTQAARGEEWATKLLFERLDKLESESGANVG